jgi:hypothetical protein
MRFAWILLVAGCGFESPLTGEPGGTGGTEEPSPPTDAGFDYAQCPPSYNAALPGPSRYRLIATGHSAWDHGTACSMDLPGATHLVVLETMTEFTNVKGLVDSAATNAIVHNAVWIGTVQPRAVTLPTEGWLALDGAPLITAWDLGEPNDGGNEGDHNEQFVFYEHNRLGLADVPGNTNSGALCECDGKPIDPAVAALIASYH